MNYKILLISVLFFSSLNAGDEVPMKQDSSPNLEAEKEGFLEILIEQLSKNLISADAGWEFYSNLTEGRVRDKLLVYINILAEIQKVDQKHIGYRIGVRGVFIHACSEVLSVPSETILRKFSKHQDNNKDMAILDARKLFIGIHDGDL